MLIKKVNINNFFCFLGENKFVFEKGLNIISSPNKGGKSQLFNTFFWTFFDQIYIENENDNGKKVWKSSNNIITIPDALAKDDTLLGKIKTSVEIIVEAESPSSSDEIVDLLEYTFKKTVVYEKNKNGISEYNKPELIISYIDSGETKILAPALHSSTLERIFPFSVRKFMWYQGETMDNLYDFNHSNTLKNAIREISYYPIYDNMEKVVKASSISIAEKIEKALKSKNQLTKEQSDTLTEINALNKSIQETKEKIGEIETIIEGLDEEIATEESKFRTYDKYKDIKIALETKEFSLQSTISLLDQQDAFLKEKLVEKWMLFGSDSIIEESEQKLNIIQTELQKFINSSNPVPMSLPGPEYVQRMLDDNRCYICERDVENNTEAYEALKRRLDDFQKDANYKTLQDNFTELYKAKHNLLLLLPEIKDEIEKSFATRDEYIKKRNQLKNEIRKIEQNADNDNKNIKARGSNAEQILNKLNSLKNDRNSKKRNIEYYQNIILQNKDKLSPLEIKKSKYNFGSDDSKIVENIAEDYIKLFDKAITLLNKDAYKTFIDKLQEESNRLYSLYLGGNPQGKIVIGQGTRILDFETEELLTNLNTGELVAEKLAVANAILSLSEKVKNKIYPIVADAPSSDLDPENTINLTMNIGKSFEQMIILSKDYISLNIEERDNLIKEAGIVKFYELKHGKIDPNGSESRRNKKTFINIIK